MIIYNYLYVFYHTVPTKCLLFSIPNWQDTAEGTRAIWGFPWRMLSEPLEGYQNP